MSKKLEQLRDEVSAQFIKDQDWDEDCLTERTHEIGGRMTPMEFCLWLAGYFEGSVTPTVDERGREHSAKNDKQLSAETIKKIKKHLQSVLDNYPVSKGIK